MTLLDLELGRERDARLLRTPEDTYATGLMFLAERFHLLLEAEDDLGLIVVDSRFREDDARLRRFFADLTKDGTPYMQLAADRRGPLPRPEPLLDRAPVRRPRRRDDRRRRARQRAGRGYLRKLLPRFATHPATGELDGVGLKRFPEQVPPTARAAPALLKRPSPSA